MTKMKMGAGSPKVYEADQDPAQEIERVTSIDTIRCLVEIIPRRTPGIVSVRLADDRDDLIAFDRIETEVDGNRQIIAFHCYGRNR